MRDVRASERGAILIHVAVAFLVLLAFSAFVVDYGVVWVSRTQAQSAADAAAHAGAVALSKDSFHDRSDTGPAKQIALQTALAQTIWGETPSVALADITFPLCPDDGTDGCVRVDVYRDAAHANALPSWFSALITDQPQGVRAMAVAKVAAGNASDCLKPFAIPDLYTELSSPPNDEFNDGVDSYTPPGYQFEDPDPNDGQQNGVGTILTVRYADSTSNSAGPGWFRLVDLVGGTAGGTNEVRDAIRSCSADVHAVGGDLQEESGFKAGIKHGIEQLLDLDPSATWNPVTKTVENSCVETNSCQKYLPGSGAPNDPTVPDPGRTYSPKIVPLAVYDPQIYASEERIHIVNIFGFFLQGVVQNGGNFELTGVIVTQPGLLAGAGGPVDPEAAFLQLILLIR